MQITFSDGAGPTDLIVPLAGGSGAPSIVPLAGGSGTDPGCTSTTYVLGKNKLKIPVDPVTGKIIGGVTGKGFVKGDPRINRFGTPKNSETLRKAVTKLLNSEIINDEGEKVTALENLVRDWALSKNFQKQNGVLERGFGKVKEQVQVEIDMKQLTREQLERLAKGEDIVKVLANK